MAEELGIISADDGHRALTKILYLFYDAILWLNILVIVNVFVHFNLSIRKNIMRWQIKLAPVETNRVDKWAFVRRS